MTKQRTFNPLTSEAAQVAAMRETLSGRDRRVPPMIRCPLCQPGIVSYAGVVVNVVCRQCREAVREAGA